MFLLTPDQKVMMGEGQDYVIKSNNDNIKENQIKPRDLFLTCHTMECTDCVSDLQLQQ
jgi:hypothetical protein